MEKYPTFEWILHNQDRSQQWTVRCDDFEQFVVAIQQVLSIMPRVEVPVPVEQLATEQNGTGPDAVLERAPATEKPLTLVKSGAPPAVAQPEAEPATTVCYIHTDKDGKPTPMKLRSGKNGQVWHDHRWKEGDGWHQCNGQQEWVQSRAEQQSQPR